MVNNQTHRLLVPGACSIVVGSDGRHRISNGPVYDLVGVKKLVTQVGLRVLNTRADEHMVDMFSPEMTDEELAEFICELQSSDRKGAERCETSVGMTLDCDSYAMKWDRKKRTRWVHGFEIYVKFGFSLSSPCCLIVSAHP